MIELIEEHGSVSCADLSAFSSNYPKDILMAIKDRILELSVEHGGIVRLVGPFQEET